MSKETLVISVCLVASVAKKLAGLPYTLKFDSNFWQFPKKMLEQCKSSKYYNFLENLFIEIDNKHV